MKLWAGRFQKETDDKVNDFNSSISFDARLYRQDITGSIAHATMLGEHGIIAKEEAEKIVETLKVLLQEIEEGKVEFTKDSEDIHMNMEVLLTQRIGATGKRLHTARSRNDQVALDFRLFVKEEIPVIVGMLLNLEKALIRQAEGNLDAIMPGYTHLQRAQPITFAHAMMAYANMFLRDLGRLSDTNKRMNYCPLGSGALAGTTYPIDREMTASLLGFDGPMLNSLDGVSDRDFCIELCSAISTIMMHMSRLSEEIILWCSWEFKFMELDDAFATGSSIMPQKKNPDVAELVRGKTGRVYGDLVTLLSMMKSLPLAYNKDMQEDKEAIFDAIDTVKLCLVTFDPMLATAKVLPDNMRAAAAKGFINATDCADYLTKKGVPFRDAYKITGTLVAKCIDQNCTMETLPLAEYQKLSDAFEDDVYDAINLTTCAFTRNCIGGPAKERVKEQIAAVKAAL